MDTIPTSTIQKCNDSAIHEKESKTKREKKGILDKFFFLFCFFFKKKKKVKPFCIIIIGSVIHIYNEESEGYMVDKPGICKDLH